MSEEVTTQQQETGSEKNVMACLAFCPALFFIPFLTNDAKNNEVAQNSMNQGLLGLIVLICVNLLNTVVGLLPYSIMRIANIIIVVLSLCILGLIIVGMVRAYNNKIFKLPIIGNIDIFKKIKGEN